jgi:hypothetical protein
MKAFDLVLVRVARLSDHSLGRSQPDPAGQLTLFVGLRLKVTSLPKRLVHVIMKKWAPEHFRRFALIEPPSRPAGSHLTLG